MLVAPTVRVSSLLLISHVAHLIGFLTLPANDRHKMAAFIFWFNLLFFFLKEYEEDETDIYIYFFLTFKGTFFLR